MLHHINLRHRLPVLAGALLLALATALPARAAFEEKVSVSGRTLWVGNLIGEIEIGPATGDTFEITVKVDGRDANRDAIQVEVDEGAGARVLIRFPTDQRRFVYPRLGSGSRTSFTPRELAPGGSGGFWSKLFGNDGRRITVSGGGGGAEMWADVHIAVPRGAELVVRHGVGNITATDVEGGLVLDSNSGRVDVAEIRGNVLIDTGSGGVKAESVAGDLSIDTGSGDVILRRCESRSIEVDTGSGGVEGENLWTSRLSVDTGSGRVSLQGVAADEALVDTGSGGVDLRLERMGHGRFKIDTGSGGIRLSLPAEASAEVRAETGSGGIHVDLDGINMLSQSRDHMRFSIGGGEAQVDLDTGSGGIRISRAQ